MRYALQKGQIPLPKINLKPGSKVRRKAVYKVESEKKPVESYEIQMPEMKKPKKKSTKWSFLSRKKNTDRVKPEEEILPQELTQFPVEPGPSSFSYDEDIDTRIRSVGFILVPEPIDEHLHQSRLVQHIPMQYALTSRYQCKIYKCNIY